MKKVGLILAVAAMAVFAVGCAITDYDGIPGHKTTGDAKLWGKEISFSGFGENSDGTYSYVVSYDNNQSGSVRIGTLRNEEIASFSRDGLVDRDGDDVQGNSGDSGGRFLPYVTAVDTAKGSCEFDANINPGGDKSKGGLGILLCINGFQEEVDNDHELNARFSSLDDLLKQVWSGALSGRFSLELTSIKINGVSYPVDNLRIRASTTATSIGRLSLNGSHVAVPGLIQTILDNTEHRVPVSIGLGFAGGLRVNAPSGWSVAFDHDVLGSLL